MTRPVYTLVLLSTRGQRVIERGEAIGTTAEQFVVSQNRDNLLSGAEVVRGSLSDVDPPTTTYSDARLHWVASAPSWSGITTALERKMTQLRYPHQSHQVDLHADDSDLQKGAIEGFPDGQGNPSGPGLDDQGWPNDEVATAQDRIGANEDKTQG